MTLQKLEMLTEVDVYISPTAKGIGVTMLGDNDAGTFYEFTWNRIIRDLLEEHTLKVLKKDKTHIHVDSKKAITEIASSLQKTHLKLLTKLNNLKVVDN